LFFKKSKAEDVKKVNMIVTEKQYEQIEDIIINAFLERYYAYKEYELLKNEITAIDSIETFEEELEEAMRLITDLYGIDRQTLIENGDQYVLNIREYQE
jgi:hypothetical protein